MLARSARVIKSLSNYVFQVKDLHNVQAEKAHGNRLKFHHDGSLDKEAIVSYIILSEMGMPLQRLIRLEGTKEGMMVLVCWRGLRVSKDTLEPLAKLYEFAAQSRETLFIRKNTSQELVEKARRVLAI